MIYITLSSEIIKKIPYFIHTMNTKTSTNSQLLDLMCVCTTNLGHYC